MSIKLLPPEKGLDYVASKLDRHNLIGFDTETNGLNYFDNSRIVGFCVAWADNEEQWFDMAEVESYYIPIRHLKDKHLNYDGRKVLQMFDRHLRRKSLCGYNIKFDINMCRADRVYLDSCDFHDTQLMYSMLHGNRVWSETTLSAVGKKVLGTGKNDSHINKERMAYHSPMEVAEYGAFDAELSLRLYFKMYPKLCRYKLDRSYNEIERRIIPYVADMEWNGVRVEGESLSKLRIEKQKKFQANMSVINKHCGMAVNLNADLSSAFEAIGVSPMDSYDKNHMARKVNSKKLDLKQKTLITLMIETKKLCSLIDKYLSKYEDLLDSNGFMRYNLHSWLNRHGGTKTGRFSSSAYGTKKHPLGCNIQQVEKGDLRKTFITTNPHSLWVSADADQQEYRLFAGKCKNKSIIESYRKDPKQSFHKMTLKRMLELLKRELEYQHMKNFNFMIMYGGGKSKVKSMLLCSDEEAQEVYDAYNRMIPEGKRMRRSLSEIAERRGYIRTISGRIVRVDKPYAALNAYIQGSGADDTKTRIIQLYEANIPGLLFHFTVHDEVDFELPNEGIEDTLELVRDVLMGRQDEGIYADLDVPLRWEINNGDTWGDCK